MSHRTYNEEWKDAQRKLTIALQIEPQQPDRHLHRQTLCELYLRYIVIANRLSECVDQIVQPQKRILLRRLLESTLGRILELKTDLVESDLCEYTYFGEALDKLGLNTHDTELKIPPCFLRERKEEMEDRRRVMDEVLEKFGFLEQPVKEEPMTEAEAVQLIQIHERARQGRLRAQFMKEIRMLKEKTKPHPGDGAAEEDEESARKANLAAALRIQKIWRGYAARRRTRRRKFQEMMLIGMIPPPKTKSAEIARANEVRELRRSLQEVRQKEYEEAISECRETLEKTQREVVLEHLTDQVRGWLNEYRAHTGKLPEYTGSDRSVSRMMLSRQGTESEISKSTATAPSSKDSKGKKKSAKAKTKGESEEEEADEGSKAIASVFLPDINAKNDEYDDVWKFKEESSNPQQKHYYDMIQNEQMSEMENELRKTVDEMMRAELQLLQEALDKDRGHKGKKPKKASKRVKRTSKKGKKKKDKDLTPDRSTESLFEELVANGIIRKYPEVKLEYFKGERSHWNHVPCDTEKEAPMALGDLRELLIEYCILPLCSSNLHQSTPLTRSLLIAGAHGSGKDMLVHALCTEAGALLFDLSPANIVGKYPGKSGLVMLMHLVNKVSRLLQPSVIYMNAAEKPFMKRTAKGDKTDPKRLKKDLPKLVKGFCPEDRVMLIGVSHCPWDGDQKLLQQVYQKYLVIPKPNYSSRHCVWKHFLGQYSAISWQFDMSGMSKISDGYTVGSIIETINEVMTVKRMVQLQVHPLNPAELINSLCKRTPVYREEEEAMSLWWTKTPMGRRRQKAIETRLEEEAEKLVNSKGKKKK